MGFRVKETKDERFDRFKLRLAAKGFVEQRVSQN